MATEVRLYDVICQTGCKVWENKKREMIVRGVEDLIMIREFGIKEWDDATRDGLNSWERL